MINYNYYNLDREEKIKYTIYGIVLISFVLWIFFKSVLLCFTSIFFIKYYLKIKKKHLAKERIDKLRYEFIEFLLALNDSLKGGNSLEKSVENTKQELVKISGKDSLMVKEVNMMINKIRLNIPVDEILTEFAVRSGIREIVYFSDIVSISKKRGGNMIKMISECIETLISIIESKKEVQSIIAGKVTEKRIMDKIPLFIIVYVSLTSGDIMQPLYTTLYGRIIMALTLISYIFVYYIGERIVDIKI